jgi:hypothetical protein
VHPAQIRGTGAWPRPASRPLRGLTFSLHNASLARDMRGPIEKDSHHPPQCEQISAKSLFQAPRMKKFALQP